MILIDEVGQLVNILLIEKKMPWQSTYMYVVMQTCTPTHIYFLSVIHKYAYAHTIFRLICHNQDINSEFIKLIQMQNTIRNICFDH